MNERERDESGFSGPDEVTRMLDELKDVDPPADLVGTVMSRISSQAPVRAERAALVQMSGGKAMAKKVLWSVMGAAAAVLIVLKLAGYPPKSDGTEGTIGAAQRYQSQQIADKDVKVTDAELQKFIQSDVFHKLVNDKAARKALASKDVQKALADSNLLAVLGNEQVRYVLANEQLRDVLVSDQVLAALSNEQLLAALSNEQVRNVLANEQLRAVLANQQLREVLVSDQLHAALTSDALIGLLAAPNFADMMAAPGFTAALDAAALEADAVR